MEEAIVQTAFPMLVLVVLSATMFVVRVMAFFHAGLLNLGELVSLLK